MLFHCYYVICYIRFVREKKNGNFFLCVAKIFAKPVASFRSFSQLCAESRRKKIAPWPLWMRFLLSDVFDVFSRSLWIAYIFFSLSLYPSRATFFSLISTLRGLCRCVWIKDTYAAVCDVKAYEIPLEFFGLHPNNSHDSIFNGLLCACCVLLCCTSTWLWMGFSAMPQKKHTFYVLFPFRSSFVSFSCFGYFS